MTIVLVTGASGFVGSHVVGELLREGYTVRGAVRSHNVARVNKSYESSGDRFSTVVIDDLISSDLVPAVKGVDAIIHVASPLAHAATPDVVLDSAVTGTTRILDAALAAGVTKLVITESIASLAAPDEFWTDTTITEQSRSPLTREDAFKPGASGFDVYCVSKNLSDLAVRTFQRAHPEFDIATIHPSYIYGPLGPGQVYDAPGTGTNRFVHALIAGARGRPVGGYDRAIRGPPLSVDVRDVARAHVLALKLSPSESGAKRYILSTSTFRWSEAVELLAEKRPELRERLPVVKAEPTDLGPVATLDTSKTESVLGMRNYLRWQDTVLDTVDDLLRVEKGLSG